MSLIVYPRFGFNASDSPRLRGMARRNTSIESGPALNFDFGVGVVSMAYVQDVSGASHGGTFRLLAEREFHIQSNLAVDVILTWEQLSAKTANYYYGVPTNEITPTRSFYQPQSDRILNANLQFTYDFAGRHALLFGGELSVLGDHLAASPIVERRWSRTLYIGYGWRL